MRKNEFKNLLSQGYGLTFEPPKDFDIEKEESLNVLKVELHKNDLLKILKGDIYPYLHIAGYCSIIIGKCNDQIHIKPEDLFTFLKQFNGKADDIDVEYIEDWLNLLDRSFGGKRLFLPDIFADAGDDLFLDNPDNLVNFVLNDLIHGYSDAGEPINGCKIIKFINESIENRGKDIKERKYSKDSLLFLLENLDYVFDEKTNLDKELTNFYVNTLLKLASTNNYKVLLNLGYNYYEGINGFEVNFNKSLYYLEKCYKMKQDPFVARTIGYIYYYGRTTNGVPVGDKAFQYFAIGYFAGRSTEATYKLADCYVKGYGTPVSHESAYNIVREIYDEEHLKFLNHNPNKFPDVALRMGSYYKDGIGVTKDYSTSYRHYLIARHSIKKRIEEDEYIGDRSVALAISKGIEELESTGELSFDGTRNISHDGYVLSLSHYFEDDEKYKICKVDTNVLDILISKKHSSEFKNMEILQESLGLYEESNTIKIRFITKVPLPEINDDVKVAHVNYSGQDEITISFKNRDLITFSYDELIYVPSSIIKLTKDYIIARVRFDNSDKTYDYLCLNHSVKVGDALNLSNDKNKKVTVVDIKHVYEDQLPLPLDKIGKIE